MNSRYKMMKFSQSDYEKSQSITYNENCIKISSLLYCACLPRLSQHHSQWEELRGKKKIYSYEAHPQWDPCADLSALIERIHG